MRTSSRITRSRARCSPARGLACKANAIYLTELKYRTSRHERNAALVDSDSLLVVSSDNYVLSDDGCSIAVRLGHSTKNNLIHRKAVGRLPHLPHASYAPANRWRPRRHDVHALHFRAYNSLSLPSCRHNDQQKRGNN